MLLEQLLDAAAAIGATPRPGILAPYLINAISHQYDMFLAICRATVVIGAPMIVRPTTDQLVLRLLPRTDRGDPARDRRRDGAAASDHGRDRARQRRRARGPRDRVDARGDGDRARLRARGVGRPPRRRHRRGPRRGRGGPRDSLHLADVVEVYERAGEALARAVQVAHDAASENWSPAPPTLLRARVETEKVVMADYAIVGR